MRKIFVYVANGKQVRKIENPKEFVKPDGDTVPDNAYYRRRIKDGDLVIMDTI